MTSRRGFFGAIASLLAAPKVFDSRRDYEFARPGPDAEHYGNVSYLIADRKTFVTFPTYREGNAIIADPHKGTLNKVRILESLTPEFKEIA